MFSGQVLLGEALLLIRAFLGAPATRQMTLQPPVLSRAVTVRLTQATGAEMDLLAKNMMVQTGAHLLMK